MALVFKRNIDSDTSFAVWKIEEEAEELYNQLQLKEHELNYLQSLNNGKRNLHWLSTRVLLRKMLDTPEYIDCQVDENGKPYLTNFPYSISLSHSFEYAAVMISKSKKVGIDIELIKEKVERIANKFLSDDEMKFMNSERRVEHLYVCWCAKEAVYKLHGKKNVSFLDNIHIQPFDFPGNGSLVCSLKNSEIDQTFTVEYEEFDNYMIGYTVG